MSPPRAMWFSWERPATRATLEQLADEVRARTELEVGLRPARERDGVAWTWLTLAGPGLDEAFEVQANPGELLIVADDGRPHGYCWPNLARAAIALGATSRYRLPAMRRALARPWPAVSRWERVRVGPGRRAAHLVLGVLSLPFWPYWIARSALGERGRRR